MSTKASLVGMTAAIFVLSACTEEEPAKIARTWTCTPVTMGGTKTLACASSSLTADGPSTTGAKGSTTDGVSDPTGGEGGSAVDVYVAIWTDHDSSYRCHAGAESCPPVGAHAGTNTSDGVSSDGTGAAGAGGAASPGTTSDGTNVTAGDPTSGGATSVNGSGGASGDGSIEQYDCRAKGDVVACVKHDGSAGSTSGGTTSGGSGPGGGSGVGAETETSNGTTVKYDGSTDNGDGTTTSCWTVTEHGHDLVKWVISIGRCEIVRRSPTIGYAIVIRDESSGLTGVSWSTETEFTTGQFCMTVKGAPTISKVKFSANASGESYGTTQGPVCPCE
jgi:hypothetical protein